MPEIIKLTPSLVNKIAAGEVIERPASVVKELVENAVDAGAKHVDVEVREGGSKLMRVQDDGRGIGVDDLPLALESHATSKLRSADDLFRVGTLGFRGEALASISAVSRIEVTSRAQGSDFGATITAEGGRVENPSPSGTPPGTTVTVENLFFNTPVRRKFLKSDSTELAHISETIMKIGLANSAVGFSLTHNGRKVFNVPPAADVIERIAAWYGREFSEKLLQAHGDDGDMEIFAFIGEPGRGRATSKTQIIFVNSRPIRDRSLLHAVKQAFEGYLPFGKQPVVFLFISVDPASVDVNVHPTKMEVRFRHGRSVYSLTKKLIRGALEEKAGVPLEHSLYDGLPASPGYRERITQLVGEYIHRERGKGGRSAQQSLGLTPRWERPVGETETPDREPALFADYVFQVHNSYIIVETPQGIDIIDQHALHERILFEELKTRFADKRLETQQLLIPEVLNLDAVSWAVLRENWDFISSFGFELSEFGEGAVSISSVPQILDRAGAADLVGEIVRELADSPEGATPAGAPLERIMKLMSCKAAVKAGQKLSRGEILALLQKQGEISGIHTCPHGRPTTISFTLSELEKQFQRK